MTSDRDLIAAAIKGTRVNVKVTAVTAPPRGTYSERAFLALHFPPSPSVDQYVYRLDLGMGFRWDGTRWVSVERRTIPEGHPSISSKLQESRLNPLLGAICRLTGWNYFWFWWAEKERRGLAIGPANEKMRLL